VLMAWAWMQPVVGGDALGGVFHEHAARYRRSAVLSIRIIAVGVFERAFVRRWRYGGGMGVEKLRNLRSG
jgi:hypothetical protein